MKPAGFPFVSVIVPVRNEGKNIHACLTSILQQDYPPELLEVILVNDHSTDDTVKIAEELALSDKRLSVIHLGTGIANSYKKAAISAGIKIAQGEVIVQTDGDCMVGTSWLSSMMAFLTPAVALVSGPVQMRYKNNFFEQFQALESMGLVAIGAGSLAAKRPNMCNGANMAYRKEVFLAVGGFAGVDRIASGDDELLLQKIHANPRYKLAFAKDPKAIVVTDAVESWADFKAQRLRWVSKARHYPNKAVNVAQLITYLFFWCLPLSLLFACLGMMPLYIPLVIFTAKTFIDFLLMHQATRFFNQKQLMRMFIFMQLPYILYVLWVGLAGNIVRTYRWKDRNVR